MTPDDQAGVKVLLLTKTSLVIIRHSLHKYQYFHQTGPRDTLAEAKRISTKSRDQMNKFGVLNPDLQPLE